MSVYLSVLTACLYAHTACPAHLLCMHAMGCSRACSGMLLYFTVTPLKLAAAAA